MARVYDNWERLVRATLKREQLRSSGQGHERVPSGIAGAVPPSLGKTTNIDAILQAADAIYAEDPNVYRICKPSHFEYLKINVDFFQCSIVGSAILTVAISALHKIVGYNLVQILNMH